MGCCGWQGGIYFSVSVLLAFLAISSARHSIPKTEMDMKTVNLTLSLNASKALRRSGFNVVATLLHISPEIFLSSSTNSTIFAIKDSALFNTTTSPPWILKNLLQYHTSPLKLTFDDLQNTSCFSTLLPHTSLAVTKVDVISTTLEINFVPVTHPNIFLEDSLAIHGILGPFSSIDLCLSDSTVSKNIIDIVGWSQIIHQLSSKGFVPFAIGLHSVLLQHNFNVSAVTVFAPPDLALVASNPQLLYKTVGVHILPQRLTYMDLASLSDKTLLATLVPHHRLSITVTSTEGFNINRVPIVAPDIILSDRFVVHGIPEAFNLAGILNSSI